MLLPLLKRFFLVLAHQFFVLELLSLECVLILLILVLQIRYLLVFPHIVNLQLKHIKRTAIFTLGIGRCETEALRLDLLSLFDKLVASAGLGGLRGLTGSSLGLEQRWTSIRQAKLNRSTVPLAFDLELIEYVFCFLLDWLLPYLKFLRKVPVHLI